MDIVSIRLPIGRWRSKDIGFKFSILAWYKLCEINGIDLDKLAELPQQKMIEDLVYTSAFAYYVDIKKIPKWLKPDIGTYWLSNMTVPQYESWIKAMHSSEVMKKAQGKEVKKK